ncbi:MAG: hypothetical protein V7707_08070 [Motiliproteus sp.]
MTTTTPTQADEQHRLDCLATFVLTLPPTKRDEHLARMKPLLQADIRARMLTIFCQRLVGLTQQERISRMARLRQMAHSNHKHQVFYQQVSKRVAELLQEADRVSA